MPSNGFDEPVDRRLFLQSTGAGLAMAALAETRAFADDKDEEPSPVVYRPRVAAIVTEYRGYSHAEIIVDRFIQGYNLTDTETYWARTQVVSLFLDQIPAGDLGRGMAVQAGAKIVPTIRDALTLGTGKLAVDGVLLIGEHGQYPKNAKGQHQYPRRRFFEETVRTFQDVGNTAAVFNDKGFGYRWEDAKWMYDQARTMGFPLMAGSSVPNSYRKPEMDVALGTEFEECLEIGRASCRERV